MALDGQEILQVQGITAAGTLSGQTFITTTQEIANLAGNGSTVTASGNIVFTTANAGVVFKEGANGRVGTFTASGTAVVTVSNTAISTTDCIIATVQTVGGTVGPAYISAKQVGASFTIKSLAGDTSLYHYTVISSQA